MQALRPEPAGEIRRVAYMGGLLLAIPVILATWLVQYEQPFVRWVYPWFALLCFQWAWRLQRKGDLSRIEAEVLWSVGVLFLLKMAHGFFWGDLRANWVEIEGSYWVMAFVMILAYIVFPPRQGFWFSLALMLVTLLLGLLRLVPEVLAGNHQQEFLAFLRGQMRLVAMGGLLYLLALLKDHLAHAHQQVAQMHILARTDPLTNLPNRLALSERLEAESQQMHGLYVVLLDIDRFKQINDRFGHAVGDEVLREVGRRLRGSLRKDDMLGRWGGEEFMIILRGDSQHDVLAAMERLREDIVFWPFEGVGTVSASFGVAEGHLGDSIHHLLERADRALYQAKQLGRNRVELALG
ncbi:GGDEF domain-containing protein [Meiothermus rufus]|uniref:GGDEF domain-containing protein n=1 Tax=Meiothermus rufus TaxID=604332 RepID=UPI000485AF1E|nr:GGDEF domain-containing protein [Meiothermus rufus]